MTLDESSYILDKFDGLMELLSNPVVGPPKIGPRVKAMLRNELVGAITACVLDGELQDWQEAERVKAMAVQHTGTISVSGQTAECKLVSVSFVSNDAAALDEFVQLSQDLWVDKDGCVRLKE